MHDDLILSELQALRKDFNKYALDMESRTTALETQMHSLMGNGNPGRMALVERAVEMLNRWRWWVLGCAAGCSSLIGVIGWLIK
jgi:hypothetical protein